MRSLQKQIREIKPDKIIMVWDGEGGSRKRRSIIKEYKDGRKPLRVNRSIRNLTDEQEIDNKNYQMFRLIEYLNNFPIIQIMESNIEADDIISFLCQNFDDNQKIIVSSDKDFIQLLSKNTILYRPTQDDIKTVKGIIEEYNIHPNNFALARSIVGDKSDNLKGVYGIGLKTVSKLFPELKQEKTIILNEIKEICEQNILNKPKTKAFKEILDNFDLIRKNYSVMNLVPPIIVFQTTEKIRNILTNFKPEFNKTETIKMMIEDGLNITERNLEEMFIFFQKLIKEDK